MLLLYIQFACTGAELVLIQKEARPTNGTGYVPLLVDFVGGLSAQHKARFPELTNSRSLLV